MVTLGLVAALDTVRAQIDELEGEIIERLGTHADAAIFTSLPRSGRVRAAALLAEIGDCRARFPDAESLTCLAGAAPSPGGRASTRRSCSACLRQEAPGRGHGLRR
jgi:transposase